MKHPSSLEREIQKWSAQMDENPVQILKNYRLIKLRHQAAQRVPGHLIIKRVKALFRQMTNKKTALDIIKLLDPELSHIENNNWHGDDSARDLAISCLNTLKRRIKKEKLHFQENSANT